MGFSSLHPLCIYQICAASLEVKFNFLTAKQQVLSFNEQVLSFSVNIFTGNRTHRDRSIDNMFWYVRALQEAYFNHLKCASIIPVKKALPRIRDNEMKNLQVSDLVQGYRILVQYDKSPSRYGNHAFFEKLRRLENIETNTDSLLEGQDEWFTLSELCKHAYLVHNTHIKLTKKVPKSKLICSPDQVATEMKCFLSHIATAACQSVDGDNDNALNNIRKGNGHLERGILDMCKDILALIMHNKLLDKVDPSKSKDIISILRLRTEEFDHIGDADHFKRIEPYSELALKLCSTYYPECIELDNKSY